MADRIHQSRWQGFRPSIEHQGEIVVIGLGRFGSAMASTRSRGSPDFSAISSAVAGGAAAMSGSRVPVGPTVALLAFLGGQPESTGVKAAANRQREEISRC